MKNRQKLITIIAFKKETAIVKALKNRQLNNSKVPKTMILKMAYQKSD